MRQDNQYSTAKISPALIKEIKDSLKGLDYGSVEVYVVNNEVTQITKRHIKKTNNEKGLTKGKK